MAIVQSSPDVRITDSALVKIWYWYTTCCHRDLKRIETHDELNEVRAIMDGPYDGETVEVWESKTEALLQLREWMKNSGQQFSEDVAMIDAMPREEE